MQEGDLGRELLLVIEVRTRDGGPVEEIAVRDGDTPLRLATRFVTKTGLGWGYTRAVSEHIETKVRESGFEVDADGCCRYAGGARAAFSEGEEASGILSGQAWDAPTEESFGDSDHKEEDGEGEAEAVFRRAREAWTGLGTTSQGRNGFVAGADDKGGRSGVETTHTHGAVQSARGMHISRDSGARRRSSSLRARGRRRRLSRRVLQQRQSMERLHKVAETMSVKLERARGKRDALVDAQALETKLGQLNLCAKTRHITSRRGMRHYLGSRSSDGEGTGSTVNLHGGDRLYSEWLVAQRKKKQLQGAPDVAVQPRPSSSSQEEDSWSCPKCGAPNRGDHDTCQTVVGLTPSALEERPSTWVYESVEQLARRMEASGGVDVVTRCGITRPHLFQPASLARTWHADHDATSHEEAEGARMQQVKQAHISLSNLRKQQARQAIMAEVNAECTFRPQVPPISRWLAEERSARRRGQFGGHVASSPISHGEALYSYHFDQEERRLMLQQAIVDEECPFTPDIGLSAAWPRREATKEAFVERLHGEHSKREQRLQEKRDDARPSLVDPVTGQAFFSPRINKPNKPLGQEAAPAADPGLAPASARGLSCHARLWAHSQRRLREQEAVKQQAAEAAKAETAAGHTNTRSAELLRSMQVRHLAQMYRTLLASVEYSQLPEDAVKDEAFESITAKISAIFDDDSDMWQSLALEVDRADCTVLKPEMVDIVASALKGQKGKTVTLSQFCALLDATMAKRRLQGPTAHLLANRKAPAAGARESEELAEKELTFAPRINQLSAEMAKAAGRDGSQAIEDVLRRELSKMHKHKLTARLEQDKAFRGQCTFQPALISKRMPNSRYPNEREAEEALARAQVLAAPSVELEDGPTLASRQAS